MDIDKKRNINANITQQKTVGYVCLMEIMERCSPQWSIGFVIANLNCGIFNAKTLLVDYFSMDILGHWENDELQRERQHAVLAVCSNGRRETSMA